MCACVCGLNAKYSAMDQIKSKCEYATSRFYVSIRIHICTRCNTCFGFHSFDFNNSIWIHSNAMFDLNPKQKSINWFVQKVMWIEFPGHILLFQDNIDGWAIRMAQNIVSAVKILIKTNSTSTPENYCRVDFFCSLLFFME